MKTKIKSIVLWFAATGLFFNSLALAKESINLSAFKGNYKGSVIQTGPNMGDTATGAASVVFKVPRSGTSARVSYAATISDGMGGSSVLSTAMALSSNKNVSITDLLVGIAGANNAKSGSGRWSQRKRTLTIDATNGEGLSLRGTATVKDLRNKRKLTFTLISDDGVDTTTFTTLLRARLPRRS